MSLKHLQNRREPTIFGGDLNVLIGDTTITGDLVVSGLINGTSSQGQNTNNTWIGTNEWSVYRPSCVPTNAAGFSGVNLALEEETMIANSIINQGANFAGSNSFGQSVLLPNLPIPVPVNATDGVTTSYITSLFATQQSSFLSANNTWTNSNTFSILPTCLDPVLGGEVATKNYVDTQLSTVVQGGTDSTVSNINLTNETFSTSLACSIQIIGAGGGSTSGIGADCSSAGVAGASGSAASLLILNKTIGGISGGQWSITCGTGGSGALCDGSGGSGNGVPTNLFVVPVGGNGLNPASVNVLRANGGGGCPASCGSNGKSGGGTYSAINPLVLLPLCASSGTGGVQCGATTPQYTGINTFGWGNRSGVNKNGGPGVPGGYGIVNYFG